MHLKAHAVGVSFLASDFAVAVEPGEGVAGVVREKNLARRAGVAQQPGDGGAEVVHSVAAPRGNGERGIPAGGIGRGFKEINFVPHGKHGRRLVCCLVRRENFVKHGLNGETLFATIRRGGVADMQNEIGEPHFLKGRAERLNEFVRQVGDETHRVRQHDIAGAVQADAAHFRVKGFKKARARLTAAARQRVEKSGFPGVAVSDEGDDLQVLSVSAARALCRLCAREFREFAPRVEKAAIQKAAVKFQLPLAGPGGFGGGAALSFKVCPGAHEAGALPGEARERDLQASGARARADGEDLKNKTRAVEHLRAEDIFQVALLARREGGVYEDEFGGVGEEPFFEAVALSGADEGGGARGGRTRRDDGVDFQSEGFGEVSRLAFAAEGVVGAGAGARLGVERARADDKNASGAGGGFGFGVVGAARHLS